MNHNLQKKIAIMQPYFFPYIGYIQLMYAVDEFVIYDNIQFTKKGWINRNRYLNNATDSLFTIPLKKSSDYVDIVEKQLSDDFDRQKLLQKIAQAYKKAPYFEHIFPLFQECINYQPQNLFDYIKFSIEKIVKHLGISTKITVSSSIDMDHSLKCEKRVLEICRKLNAAEYINPIGGIELYDRQEFTENGLRISFLKSGLTPYKQFENNFIPALSILDVMMFQSLEQVRQLLDDFKLL